MFECCRSGSDEIYNEKVKLLEEISALMIAGDELQEERKIENAAKEKEARKQKKLKKQGEDIRIRAMQGLKGENIFSFGVHDMCMWM